MYDLVIMSEIICRGTELLLTAIMATFVAYTAGYYAWESCQNKTTKEKE